jgi:hypothetical protein
MIRSLYIDARERRWNRDRRRRIAKMVRRERAGRIARVDDASDSVKEIATQLFEIRALPEVPEPRR